MEMIYLCDLSHTSQGINSELIPYAMGCIKSYFHAYSRHHVDVRLFKHPERMLDTFPRERPSVVGLSNYMWNLDLSYTVAQAIKGLAPQTLIVFGGPNYPLEEHRQEAWLKKRPSVDVYIIGEGERPFMEVAEIWLKTRSIEEVKRAPINGMHSIVEGRLYKNNPRLRDGFDESPRIKDLDATPSPYLAGYLDEFLKEPDITPLMECNRGCPFTCTFCVDGITARSRVNKASLGRLEQELVYIAERYRGKTLTLADTNFGMYKEDVEFCKVISKIKEKYDYPHHLQVSTGKNQKALIIECADLLQGTLRFTAAVQSMVPEILKNIKRDNISYEELVEVSKRVSATEASTYSEVILALPGDSKAYHFETTDKLVDSGLNKIGLYTLMILDGCELATDASRQKFRIKTRFRVVPRSFGVYNLEGQPLPCVEVEEVGVENETLSFDDYVECRRYALTITLFYNDNVFFELAQFIRNRGRKVSGWLRYVHDRFHQFPSKLRAIYDRFIAETIGELADNQEDLERMIKSEPGCMEKYLNGELGNNVLFNTQARAMVEAMDELHDTAFGSAKEFLKGHGIGLSPLENSYLDDLKRYSLCKKRNFLDVDGVWTENFGFDFVGMEADHFAKIPSNRSHCSLRFFFSRWKKDLIADQLHRHGKTPQALGKMFSRIPIKRLQRTAVRSGDSGADASPELHGAETVGPAGWSI